MRSCYDYSVHHVDYRSACLPSAYQVRQQLAVPDGWKLARIHTTRNFGAIGYARPQRGVAEKPGIRNIPDWKSEARYGTLCTEPAELVPCVCLNFSFVENALLWSDGPAKRIPERTQFSDGVAIWDSLCYVITQALVAAWKGHWHWAAILHEDSSAYQDVSALRNMSPTSNLASRSSCLW